MIARPITTSAAATTRTKKVASWPSRLPSARPAETRVRLTALSISSTHMNITRALRRTRMPIAPMVNNAAASSMYQSVIGPPRGVRGLRNDENAWASFSDRPPSTEVRQGDGTGGGDGEQQGGGFERQHPGREQPLADGLDRAVGGFGDRLTGRGRDPIEALAHAEVDGEADHRRGQHADDEPLAGQVLGRVLGDVDADHHDHEHEQRHDR